MAIPKFLEDIAFISKLGENPKVDNGLSTEGFKSVFDRAGLMIQNYINGTLIPELDMLVDVRALLAGILDSTLSLSDKAANARATGEAIAQKVSISGGNMTGALDMGGNKVTNLKTPTVSSDAVNKYYVDSRRVRTDVSIPASGWEGESAPYTQTIAVSGILETDTPKYGIILSGDLETKIALKAAFALVDDLDTADGSITLTCLEEKPAVDMLIQMEVNR